MNCTCIQNTKRHCWWGTGLFESFSKNKSLSQCWRDENLLKFSSRFMSWPPIMSRVFCKNHPPKIYACIFNVLILAAVEESCENSSPQYFIFESYLSNVHCSVMKLFLRFECLDKILPFLSEKIFDVWQSWERVSRQSGKFAVVLEVAEKRKKRLLSTKFQKSLQLDNEIGKLEFSPTPRNMKQCSDMLKNSSRFLYMFWFLCNPKEPFVFIYGKGTLLEVFPASNVRFYLKEGLSHRKFKSNIRQQSFT